MARAPTKYLEPEAPDPRAIAGALDDLEFEGFLSALARLGEALASLPDLLAEVDLRLYPRLRANLRRWSLQFVARAGDTPDAFAAFYELVFGLPLPPHARAWVDFTYAAREREKGVLIKAFRGSTKTTTLTIAFVAWRMGLEPHKANLLIQVGDDIAADNTAQIADIVAHNPGWKLVFPSVIPDEGRGWGAGGYEIKRADLDYPKWRELCARRKDPSLLGAGYKSGEIIGKHPDGVLIVDDIHNEINTASERELATVRNILTGTIFPTATEETWQVFVGTPWIPNDVLAYIEATGEFEMMSTPVMVDGEPTWPEKFPLSEIAKRRALSGEVEFARMFLLDLEAMKGLNLKREWLHEYPSAQVRASWPVIFGIDYASTQDKLKDKERDFFSLAIYRAIPGGGLVLVDGYRGRISKGEALDVVMSYWGVYPTLVKMGVENIGKGEEFYNDLALMNDANGRVPPLIPITHGKRGKGERFENWLAPRFQHSRIWISDAPTPWLLSFSGQWLGWPNVQHDDDLDAAYMGAAAGEGYMPAKSDRSIFGKVKMPNPFASLGKS